jgi:hypothetical protein
MPSWQLQERTGSVQLSFDPCLERNTARVDCPTCKPSFGVEGNEEHEAYQESSEEPSHTKANHLTAYGEQKLKAPRHFQIVEWFPLQSQDSIRRVRIIDRYASHDRYDRVLFNIERANVTRPTQPKRIELPHGHKSCPKLSAWVYNSFILLARLSI